MKPNKPNFWIVIASGYFVALSIVILVYNPNFLVLKNCLLLVPLYAPLVVALNLIHKDDEDYNKELWSTRSALLCATALVVVFKIIAEKI